VARDRSHASPRAARWPTGGRGGLVEPFLPPGQLAAQFIALVGGDLDGRVGPE
jgi:hypothetical protein